jgi:hypothetical protein
VPGYDGAPIHPPIVTGLQHFLHNGPQLPSVQARIDMVLRDIDAHDRAIVIWVPGTSEYFIKPSFLKAAKRHLPGLGVTMIPYEGTWRLSSSVPDGTAVLAGVIRELRRRGDKRPIVLAGESQGAWIISNVLADPTLAREVARAALWGHPAAAEHQKFGLPGQVREVNNPDDLITMPLDENASKVLESVEQLSRMRVLTGVAGLAQFALQRPEVVGRLATQWMWAVPVVGKSHEDPHNYTKDFWRGARFLAQAIPARRAKKR